jgi:hypothetical protein
MDQARFLQLVGAELHRRGVPGYRIKDSGRRARLSLHSQLGHLAVKPYRNGKLKVEICCDGENAVDAMRALAPIRHELEACIGQPGHEEHIDGAHRVRWIANGTRYTGPSIFWKQVGGEWPGIGPVFAKSPTDRRPIRKRSLAITSTQLN